MQRRDAREEEWKPLMRPCVIRELSRPNEALTYLSYQPPSVPSCLLHTRTPTNTDDTQLRSRQTLLPGHDVTVLLSRREANACDEEEEEEEEKKNKRTTTTTGTIASHHLWGNDHASRSTRLRQDETERTKDALPLLQDSGE